MDTNDQLKILHYDFIAFAFGWKTILKQTKAATTWILIVVNKQTNKTKEKQTTTNHCKE